ncbi:hypothetical protein PM082_024294 [Marasmius tenuissimus]|nr:hypothetical protein PM082_024294 [Marasmius tenuissimus]
MWFANAASAREAGQQQQRQPRQSRRYHPYNDQGSTHQSDEDTDLSSGRNSILEGHDGSVEGVPEGQRQCSIKGRRSTRVTVNNFERHTYIAQDYIEQFKVTQTLQELEADAGNMDIYDKLVATVDCMRKPSFPVQATSGIWEAKDDNTGKYTSVLIFLSHRYKSSDKVKESVFSLPVEDQNAPHRLVAAVKDMKNRGIPMEFDGLPVSVDHWQVLSDDTLNVKFPLEPPASLKRDNKKNFAKYRPYQGTLSWRNTSSEPSAISSPNTDSIAEQPQPLKRTKTLCSPAVNGWVTNLLSQWNNPFTVSINSSTTVEGILNCIATTSFHIPFFRATLDDQPPKCLIQFHERPSSIIHPHPSLILGDILASEPEDIIVSHTILGHLTDIPTVRDIVYAFLTATTRSSPSHDENEAALYSILKVPFTPDGMGLCQLQSPFPDDFDGVYDRKPPSKSPNWSSAFTPPGSITRPHIDWYGAAEMMYHVSGEKLWLLWPGTPENLETLYNWKHKSPNNDPTITITEAITWLKGLQLVFFSAPCAWELPPCTIHMCLGFSFSGHLGVAFWSPCGFSTAQWTIEFYLSECQQRFSTVCDDTQ